MSKLSRLAYGVLIASLTLACTPKKTEREGAEHVLSASLSSQNTYTTVEGTAINLNDYHGKVVLMSYWATWCKPCIKEMPSIEAIKQKLPSDSIVFLMVSDESMEKITAFREKYTFTFEFIKLEGDLANDSVYSLPTTYIYNKKGMKEHEIVGARDWDNQKSLELLLDLVSE